MPHPPAWGLRAHRRPLGLEVEVSIFGPGRCRPVRVLLRSVRWPHVLMSFSCNAYYQKSKPRGHVRSVALSLARVTRPRRAPHRASTLGRAVGAASALRLADRYLEGRAERGPQSGQTERARRPWRESRISVP